MDRMLRVNADPAITRPPQPEESASGRSVNVTIALETFMQQNCMARSLGGHALVEERYQRVAEL